MMSSAALCKIFPQNSAIMTNMINSWCRSSGFCDKNVSLRLNITQELDNKNVSFFSLSYFYLGYSCDAECISLPYLWYFTTAILPEIVYYKLQSEDVHKFSFRCLFSFSFAIAAVQLVLWCLYLFSDDWRHFWNPFCSTDSKFSEYTSEFTTEARAGNGLNHLFPQSTGLLGQATLGPPDVLETYCLLCFFACLCFPKC